MYVFFLATLSPISLGVPPVVAAMALPLGVLGVLCVLVDILIICIGARGGEEFKYGVSTCEFETFHCFQYSGKRRPLLLGHAYGAGHDPPARGVVLVPSR